MKAAVTVKENHVFRRIYRKGQSSVQPAVVVYCQKNRQGKTRLGVTVSTKLGRPWCATASAASCVRCTACICPP